MADSKHKPYERSWCGLPLPIALAKASETTATSVVCAMCGSRYLAVVWEDIPDELRGNVRVARAWEE